MSKKKKQESDLYYLEQQREQEKKETIEQMMKRKKDKERKQRIEEKKKQEFISNQFDSEMEKVIQMTNKNNQKQGLNIKYLPYVFTEQGVAMLSAILKTRTRKKKKNK